MTADLSPRWLTPEQESEASSRPVVLRALWRGQRPAPGDYLKAPKGRVAYLVRVDAPCRGVAAIGHRMLRLTCERRRPADIQEGAFVWRWQWFPRGRRGHHG